MMMMISCSLGIRKSRRHTCLLNIETTPMKQYAIPVQLGSDLGK